MAETVVCRQLFEIVRMRIPIEIEQIGLQDPVHFIHYKLP